MRCIIYLQQTFRTRWLFQNTSGISWRHVVKSYSILWILQLIKRFLRPGRWLQKRATRLFQIYLNMRKASQGADLVITVAESFFFFRSEMKWSTSSCWICLLHLASEGGKSVNCSQRGKNYDIVFFSFWRSVVFIVSTMTYVLMLRDTRNVAHRKQYLHHWRLKCINSGWSLIFQ